MARPTKLNGQKVAQRMGTVPADQRHQSRDKHDQPRPVMVVLRPFFIVGVAPNGCSELAFLDSHNDRTGRSQRSYRRTGLRGSSGRIRA